MTLDASSGLTRDPLKKVCQFVKVLLCASPDGAEVLVTKQPRIASLRSDEGGGAVGAN